MGEVLRAENVTKAFTTGLLGGRKVVALRDVTVSIGNGEVLAVVGESGSGKTTLAKIMLKLLRPTSGRVLYRGVDITKINNKDYWRRVQAILQDPYSSFNSLYTVDRILRVTLRKYGHKGSDEVRELNEALKFVGLRPDDVLGKYPHQLSGGQLQRLMIARALLVRPEVLIADEPVSMIDASLRINILNLLSDLRDSYGMAVMFITHDLSLASYIADRVVVLYRGEIVEEGPPDITFARPYHPYTRLLIESIPLLDRAWSGRVKPLSIESYGEVRGCPFAPRCPIASPSCHEERPQPREVEPGHVVRCFKAGPQRA